MAIEMAEIERRINENIEQAEVIVSGEDCNFTLTVVSDSFEGMMPVKRQQAVMGCFTDLFQSGDLHALSVKAMTKAQWQAKQG